jgi:hypothetical protein
MNPVALGKYSTSEPSVVVKVCADKEVPRNIAVIINKFFIYM